MGASSINIFLYRARAEVASHSTAGIESIRYVQLPEMNKINRLKKKCVENVFICVSIHTIHNLASCFRGKCVCVCVSVYVSLVT